VSELGVLPSQCFDRRISDEQILSDEIAAWEHDRNANHAKANWHFTTPNARINLKHLYPSIRLKQATRTRWLNKRPHRSPGSAAGRGWRRTRPPWPVAMPPGAWLALKQRARLAKGKTVLVLGASVMGWPVEVAMRLGARVFAAASRTTHGMLAGGAEEVIDTGAAPLEQHLMAVTKDAGVDMIFDPGEAFEAAVCACAIGGRFVCAALQAVIG